MKYPRTKGRLSELAGIITEGIKETFSFDKQSYASSLKDMKAYGLKPTNVKKVNDGKDVVFTIVANSPHEQLMLAKWTAYTHSYDPGSRDFKSAYPQLATIYAVAADKEKDAKMKDRRRGGWPR